MGTVSGCLLVSTEMFDWVQVGALAGPLKDIHRVIPKPLLHCLWPVSQSLWLKNTPNEWCMLHCRYGVVQMMSGAWFRDDSWWWRSSDQSILFLSVWVLMCFFPKCALCIEDSPAFGHKAQICEVLVRRCPSASITYFYLNSVCIMSYLEGVSQ